MDAIDFHHGSCIVSVAILLVYLINIAHSVPPEYCLHSLNTSDCGGPPTPVAYYYKSGSRCEVATWRGCPTLNKFRDEVICSHICIARILRWSSEALSEDNQVTLPPVVEEPANGIEEWEQELDLMPRDEIQAIDEMIEELSHDKPPEMVKLHFGIEESTTLTSEPITDTTEKVSEETVSPETESITEETTTTKAILTTTAVVESDSGDVDEVITT